MPCRSLQVQFHSLLRSPRRLIVPNDVQWAGPLRFDTGLPRERPVASAWEIHQIPEPDRFMDGVNEALARLGEGALQKVVLSRTLRMTAPEIVDVHQLLRNLAGHNTHGYTFAVDLAAGDDSAAEARTGRMGPRTLIGASPELLVTKTGGGLRPIRWQAPRPAAMIPMRTSAGRTRCWPPERIGMSMKS